MTDVAAVEAQVEGQVGTVVRAHLFKRILKNPMGLIAIAILTVIVLLAIFADVLAPFDVNFANIGKTLAPPDSVNYLGTDSVGRDTWSRLVFGARTTLLSALLCAAVAIAIGLPAGLIAGYYSGPFDTVAGWVVNVLMALPGIIVLLTVRAAFGPSVWISMIAFGILISPGYFRLTRTAVQSVRNELYVDAARVAGSAMRASSPGTYFRWCARRSSSRPPWCVGSLLPSSPAWSSWAWVIPRSRPGV